MIRHVWSVLCRTSVVDKDSNALSLFDVFEEITLLEAIGEEGSAPVNFHLVTLWRREHLETPVTATVRVRLILPGGNEPKAPTTFRVDLSKHERLRHRLAFSGLPIVRAGAIEFAIEVEGSDKTWNEIDRIPVDVKVRVTAVDSAPS